MFFIWILNLDLLPWIIVKWRWVTLTLTLQIIKLILKLRILVFLWIFWFFLINIGLLNSWLLLIWMVRTKLFFLNNVSNILFPVLPPFGLERILILDNPINNSVFFISLCNLNKLFFWSKIFGCQDILDVIRLDSLVSYTRFLWKNSPALQTKWVSVALLSSEVKSFEENFPLERVKC